MHRSQGGAPFIGELDVSNLVSNDSCRTLGTSGLRVSPLALGTMTFDDGTWGSVPELSHQIFDRYLDAGGNFLDTANQYTGGLSEETLGAWFVRNPSRRDRVVLATKFGGTLHPDDPNAGGAGRKALHTQLHESLRRLETDQIDRYWMHQWDAHTPVEETFTTLDDLVREGSSGRSASRTSRPLPAGCLQHVRLPAQPMEPGCPAPPPAAGRPARRNAARPDGLLQPPTGPRPLRAPAPEERTCSVSGWSRAAPTSRATRWPTSPTAGSTCDDLGRLSPDRRASNGRPERRRLAGQARCPRAVWCVEVEPVSPTGAWPQPGVHLCRPDHRIRWTRGPQRRRPARPHPGGR